MNDTFTCKFTFAHGEWTYEEGVIYPASLLAGRGMDEIQTAYWCRRGGLEPQAVTEAAQAAQPLPANAKAPAPPPE